MSLGRIVFLPLKAWASGLGLISLGLRDSLVAQKLKSLPAIQTQVQSLGQGDPLEKKMASYSSILAWKIPWTVEPGRLQSTGVTELAMTEVTSFHFIFSLIQEYLQTPPPFPKLLDITQLQRYKNLTSDRKLSLAHQPLPTYTLFSIIQDTQAYKAVRGSWLIHLLEERKEPM